MAAGHLITGRAGEERAAAFLRARGLKVLETNFRCAAGEVDLICKDGDTLVFVEVKTRSSAVHGEPGQAVTRTKKTRLIRAASMYLSQHRAWNRPCRFDLVSVLVLGQNVRVEHWEDVIDVRDGLGSGHASWQPW